jgi:hypothetical protein
VRLVFVGHMLLGRMLIRRMPAQPMLAVPRFGDTQGSIETERCSCSGSRKHKTSARGKQRHTNDSAIMTDENFRASPDLAAMREPSWDYGMTAAQSIDGTRMIGFLHTGGHSLRLRKAPPLPDRDGNACSDRRCAIIRAIGAPLASIVISTDCPIDEATAARRAS